MKIEHVRADARKRAFHVEAAGGEYTYPFGLLATPPRPDNRVRTVTADPEMGAEGFTYVLEDGSEHAVPMDAVLEYNEDPNHLNELLLYRLTLAAREAFATNGLGVRQLSRLLETSPTQIYRLLDTTNYSKSVGRMLGLLHVLGLEVEVTVRPRGTARGLTTRDPAPRRRRRRP